MNREFEDFEEMIAVERPKGSKGRIIQIVIIILVAITVAVPVLLYVMVIPNHATSGSQTVAGSYNDVGASSTTEAYIVFGQFTADVAPMDVRLIIIANGKDAGNLYFNNNNYPEMEWKNGPDGASATYVDYYPAGGRINPGDYINLSGLQPNTIYSIVLFHAPTDSEMSMAGPTSFSTSPDSLSPFDPEPVSPFPVHERPDEGNVLFFWLIILGIIITLVVSLSLFVYLIV